MAGTRYIRPASRLSDAAGCRFRQDRDVRAVPAWRVIGRGSAHARADHAVQFEPLAVQLRLKQARPAAIGKARRWRGVGDLDRGQCGIAQIRPLFDEQNRQSGLGQGSADGTPADARSDDDRVPFA